MTAIWKWLPAIAAGCVLSPASWAITVYNAGNTPAGQAFVSACAGSQAYGGQPNPGDSAMITDATAPYNNCAQAQGGSVFTGYLTNPVVNPPLFQSLTPFSNTSAISAGVGQIGFYATDTGAAVDIFPGAWGSGGWNDSFTWNGPTGMWMPQLVVDANVFVQYDSCTPQAGFTCPGPSDPHDPTGEAILEVSMLSNASLLGTAAEMNAFAASNPNTINPANPLLAAKWGDWLSSTGVEMAAWKADSTTPDIIANNQIVTFAIPVTQGQQVNFGVYASYLVSGADGGNIEIASQTIDPTLSWADPGTIETLDGTAPVVAGDFGPSASGFNYSQSATPEPGAMFLVVAGLGLCGLARRRRK